MKKISIRQARVGDLLKETLAEMIQRKVKDPRVQGITITDVDVSVDLKSAHVFFCLWDAQQKTEALDGLNSAEGFLRHALKKVLRIKNIPSLKFIYDDSFDYGAKIDDILNDIHKP
ncbi:MAG: 30S ribosome-binding factor RbfA [Deltaproteobacteria bacterium]|nr:30S ribosome-binding factor RbfA [Deltaproteobacteria bacterium]